MDESDDLPMMDERMQPIDDPRSAGGNTSVEVSLSVSGCLICLAYAVFFVGSCFYISTMADLTLGRAFLLVIIFFALIIIKTCLLNGHHEEKIN